jgi:hypothetical protein
MNKCEDEDAVKQLIDSVRATLLASPLVWKREKRYFADWFDNDLTQRWHGTIASESDTFTTSNEQVEVYVDFIRPAVVDEVLPTGCIIEACDEPTMHRKIRLVCPIGKS